MAVGDQSAAAPRRGIPLWMILAGGAALGLYLLYRRRGATAAGTPSTDTGTGGVVTDPNTGLPIDPYTGLPYLPGGSSAGSTSIGDWVRSAENFLATKNYSPALISQALYDYTNQLPLSDAEAQVINDALKGAGYPPVSLPFNGTVPSTGPTGGAQNAGPQQQINTMNLLLKSLKVIGTPAPSTDSIQHQLAVIENRLAHTRGYVGTNPPASDSYAHQIAVINNNLAHSRIA